MGRRRTIARLRRSRWIRPRKNHGPNPNRRRVARKNPDPSHLAETRRRADPDRPLRNQDDLAPSQDPEDLTRSLGDQSRARKTAPRPDVASPSRRGRVRARAPRNRVPRAKTAAKRGNQDPTQATRDPPSLARNRRISGRTMSAPTGNATVAPAAARNLRRRKARRIRTISRYGRRRTACKLSDLTGRPIRTTAAATATPAVRGNRLPREEALRRAKETEVAPRIETGTGADRATDHGIDHGTGRATDRATGTEGNPRTFLFDFGQNCYRGIS